MCGLKDAEQRISLADIDTNGKPGTAKMVNAAKLFISSPGGILTLWGRLGNAKTAVLMSIVNACVLDGIEAVYTTFVDLEGWIREAFDEKKHDEFGTARDRMAHLVSVRVLVIDEFDKAKVTEWINEIRFDLLDKRYRSGVVGECGTLLAMNCDPQSLPEWISSRLYDGRNVVIENSDPDMRRLMK